MKENLFDILKKTLPPKNKLNKVNWKDYPSNLFSEFAQAIYEKYNFELEAVVVYQKANLSYNKPSFDFMIKLSKYQESLYKVLTIVHDNTVNPYPITIIGDKLNADIQCNSKDELEYTLINLASSDWMCNTVDMFFASLEARKSFKNKLGKNYIEEE